MVRELNILDLLPEVARRDDESGDLQAFTDAIQAVLDTDILPKMDGFIDIWDIDRAPDLTADGLTNFIDVILIGLGNPFTFVQDMTTNEKRRIARLMVAMYKQKGTCPGVGNAIRVLTGFESQCEVVTEHFPAWVLDVSLLGLTTYLYGGEEDLWGFEVWVNTDSLTTEDRARITAIINYMKPLESKLTQIIEGTIVYNLVRFDAAQILAVDAEARFDLVPP